MGSQSNSDNVPHMEEQGEIAGHAVSGWSTDTKLVREFDRPVTVADAVCQTVDEAIHQWSELSESPPLYQFVDVEHLDGLFKTKATDDSGWLPSANFQFQGCRITLLYGSPMRVIVDRDP